MYNILHDPAILQSCCQQFLLQIPAYVGPKARQQKLPSRWAGNKSWLCCYYEEKSVWIPAVQADSRVGIVFPHDSAQGNLLESGLGFTSGSSNSPASACAVSSTLWVGHDSCFPANSPNPSCLFPVFCLNASWISSFFFFSPFYFCSWSPLKLCQL